MAAKIMPNIPSVEPFIITKSATTNLDKQWNVYIDEFELFILASGVTESKQKLALLLHLGGKDLREIYQTLKEENDNFDRVKTKLTTYFQPKKNVTFERYQFKNAKQESGESSAAYVTRLKTLAQYCEFPDVSLNNEIRDHFIFTCKSAALRKKLLQEEDLTLTKLLEIARTKETTEKQASEISEKTNDSKLNRIDRRKAPALRQNRKPPPRKNTQTDRKNCFRCGNAFDKNHVKSCPAIGKVCYNCGKYNHLSKLCNAKPSKEVNHVERHEPDSEDSRDGNLFALKKIHRTETTFLKEGKTSVCLNGTPVNVIVDSGSSINVIDKHTFAFIQKKNRDALKIKTTNEKIYPYGVSKPLRMIGYFDTTIEDNSLIVPARVYVIDEEKAGNLIGLKTSKELELLRIKVQNVNHMTDNQSCKQRKDCFQNIPDHLKRDVEKFSSLAKGKGNF